MIATRFDEGVHPENVALEYMTEAQQALNVLTKKGRIAHYGKGTGEILASINQTRKTRSCRVDSWI